MPQKDAVAQPRRAMRECPPDGVDRRPGQKPHPRRIAAATFRIDPAPLAPDHAPETRGQRRRARRQRVVMANLAADQTGARQHEAGAHAVGAQEEIAVLAAAKLGGEPVKPLKNLAAHQQVGRGEGMARMGGHGPEKPRMPQDSQPGPDPARRRGAERDLPDRQESKRGIGMRRQRVQTGPRGPRAPDVITVEECDDRSDGGRDPGIPRGRGPGIDLAQHRQPDPHG